MHPQDLTKAVEKSFHKLGVFSLSAQCFPGLDAEETAMASPPERLRNPQMRVSTVGALRAAGFTVQRTDDRGHARLYLRIPMSDDDWKQLDDAFGPPCANPRAKE